MTWQEKRYARQLYKEGFSKEELALMYNVSRIRIAIVLRGIGR